MDAPTMNQEDALARQLGRALDDDDHPRTAQVMLAAQGALERDERVDVRSMLAQLNARERYAEAAQLGSLAWRRRPEAAAALPHALALIGTGRCTEAIAILQGWDSSWPEGRREIDMALGRAYEQLYLDARPNAQEPRGHDLVRALRCYRACFEGRLDHPLWAGSDPPLQEAISVAALLHHAQRRRPGHTNGAQLLGKVRETVLPRLEQDGDPALVGVAIEACIFDADPTERLAGLLQRADNDLRAPLNVLQRTLGRLRRLWELDPTDDREGMVLLRLQQACAARGDRGASSDAGAEVGERREARWWIIDAHHHQRPGSAALQGQRCAHPLVGENLYRLRFRVVTETVTRLEYLGDDGQWVGTRTYGDLFVNRVNLGRFDHIVLDISGRDHRGEPVCVHGWYHMNGVYHTFGPGQLGESILVEVDALITADDTLQIFNFQVEGHTLDGRWFGYDPVVLLAPVKGELTKSG